METFTSKSPSAHSRSAAPGLSLRVWSTIAGYGPALAAPGGQTISLAVGDSLRASTRVVQALPRSAIWDAGRGELSVDIGRTAQRCAAISPGRRQTGPRISSTSPQLNPSAGLLVLRPQIFRVDKPPRPTQGAF